MVTDEQMDGWRSALSGHDPIELVNAIPVVANSGATEAVDLLKNAGASLPDAFWDTTIVFDGKSLTVRQFRDEWLARLRSSLPYLADAAALGDVPFVFISYSSSDRTRATQLAVALTGAEGRRLFLDHWQLGPGDPLRERLADSIGKTGALLLLVSRDSVASPWVNEEIALALRRAEADTKFRIVPICLDDTPVPSRLADRVHLDWVDAGDLDIVAQALLDILRGNPPFSSRIDAIIRGERGSRNPYQDEHQRNGRMLLRTVAASAPTMTDTDQTWLTWELFKIIAPRYPCTLKVGSHNAAGPIEFGLYDRWRQSFNVMKLDAGQIDRGLWSVVVDPMRSKAWEASEMEHLGTTGRISFRSSCNPRTDRNPSRPSPAAESALTAIRSALEPYEQPDRELPL